MPRLFALAVALLVTLPLLGCNKSKDVITITEDGSGTIVSSYVIQLDKMRELMGMYDSFQGKDPAESAKLKPDDVPNAVSPIWFKKAAAKAKGYEITSAKESVEKDLRTTTIKAKFTTLEAAAKGGAFFSSAVTLSRVEKSEKAPKGAWKLTLKNSLSGADPQAMGGMDPTTVLTMVQEQVKTLDITVVLTLPTKILEHNGTKAEDKNEISWNVTYDKILEGTKDLSMSVVFEASDELKLKPFTHAPDAQMLTKRAMQKPPMPKKVEAKKDDTKKGPPDEKPADAKPDTNPEEAKKADEPKKDAPKSDTPKSDAGK